MTKSNNNHFNINVHKKIMKVNHLTVNFIDDSTNVITFKESNEVKNYVSQYYELVHKYYTIN